MLNKKIILDTDPGDDIDDALCLAYILREKVDLIGVTTVFCNTNLRARLVKQILRLANREDIPVYAGCGNGIKNINNVDYIFCQYGKELEDQSLAPLNDNEGCNGDSAVDFIIESAKKYGKQLEILAIGAQTNVAKAILKAPEIMKNIGRIVLMGGSFFVQYREWNIVCDPEAAEIVCKFGVRVDYISHDVTEKCIISNEQYEKILGYKTGLKGYVANLIKRFVESHNRLPILHDPLAFFYLNGGDVIMKPVEMTVETKGVYTRGMTINIPSITKYYVPRPFNDGVEHLVSIDVDENKFVENFLTQLFFCD